MGADALKSDRLVAIASSLEGHPDNVAAALLGGATIAWVDEDGAGRAVRSSVDPRVAVTVLIPQSQTETEAARGMLPTAVPYADAVFNAARSALLVHALRTDADLLFAATADRLHQDYRATAYPASLDAVHRLRAARHPAVISGAGPTVLVFAAAAALPTDVLTGFTVRQLAVSDAGAHEVVDVAGGELPKVPGRLPRDRCPLRRPRWYTASIRSSSGSASVPDVPGP